MIALETFYILSQKLTISILKERKKYNQNIAWNNFRIFRPKLSWEVIHLFLFEFLNKIFQLGPLCEWVTI